MNSFLASSVPGSRQRRPIPALTGVRFVAAFYVVAFHSLPWLQQRFALPPVIRTFLGNGYLAVSLFFILSGFILTYTYEGQIKGLSNRIKFWEARFARIYPVYFLSLMLALWFERGLSTKAKIAVLMMVQAWNPRAPELMGAWNYPAWSLSVEVFFYLCFPFILPLMSRLSRRGLFWSIVILAMASVFLHSPIQGLGVLDRNSIVASYVPLPILRLPEFVLGMTVALTMLREELRGPIHGSPGRIYIALLSALILLSVPLGAWVSVVAVPFAMLVYELACGTTALTKFLSSRLLVILGSASYAIYLLQFPVRSYIRVFFSYALGHWGNWGSALTPLILVLVSILVFYGLEEPCRRALRNYFGRRSPNSRTEDSLASSRGLGV